MSKIPRFLAALSIASAALLSGCATPVERPAFPQISFAHLPPIKLDVARVEVENRYVSPDTAPNVEHRFPVSPAATALNWGRDRLKAVGDSGVARLVVRRASVVEVPLKRTTGLKGVFTTDQAERYDGVVNVSLAITDGEGEQRASVNATARRSQTVPEDISLNEREKVWFDMTEAMMNTLNTQLEKEIRLHLGQWVK